MIPGRRSYNLIGTEDDPIPENEPVFILRAQDQHSLLTVLFYALIVETLGHDPKLAAEVRAHADLFRTWPIRKRPDL